MTIIQKIAAVAKAAAAAGGVAKTQWNPQGFHFRGIEQILNLLGPLVSEAGIVILPQVKGVERQVNGKLKETKVLMEYTITDGQSSVTVSSIGWGADASDKSDSKALTMAFKAMLTTVFTLPYGAVDGDAEHVVEEPATIAKRPIPALPEPETAPNPPASREELREAFNIWKKTLGKEGPESELKREFLADLPPNPTSLDVADLLKDLEGL